MAMKRLMKFQGTTPCIAKTQGATSVWQLHTSGAGAGHSFVDEGAGLRCTTHRDHTNRVLFGSSHGDGTEVQGEIFALPCTEMSPMTRVSRRTGPVTCACSIDKYIHTYVLMALPKLGTEEFAFLELYSVVNPTIVPQGDSPGEIACLVEGVSVKDTVPRLWVKL